MNVRMLHGDEDNAHVSPKPKKTLDLHTAPLCAQWAVPHTCVATLLEHATITHSRCTKCTDETIRGVAASHHKLRCCMATPAFTVNHSVPVIKLV